jgi:hypothetical protein
MKQNINEELNYMKYLLGYKKGVVISEQETTPAAEPATTQQGGDGCQEFTSVGRFAEQSADGGQQEIQTLINDIISKPEFKNGGTITSIKITGGASNVEKSEQTSWDLDNNYNENPDTKINRGPKYNANIGYATKRANTAQEPVIKGLAASGINLAAGVTPVIEAKVIYTYGTSDSSNATKIKSGEVKPGQVVIVKLVVCPVAQQKSGEEIDKLPYLEPKLIPTTPGEIINTIDNLIECYENSEIKIFYGNPRKGHNCNKALYNVYANGIQLKRADGKNYASLNNVGDEFDDAEIINGESRKECGRLNRCGRSNTFTLDKITNESFFNKDVLFKHNGGLVITAACVDKGQGSYGGETDCHADVGDVSFKIKGVSEEVMEATNTPNMFNVPEEIGNFKACKTFKLPTAK